MRAPSLPLLVLLSGLAGCLGLAVPAARSQSPAPPAASAAQREAWKALRQKAIDAYGMGNYEEAERLFDQGAAQALAAPDPLKAASFMVNRGFVQHARHAYKEAEASYRQALALDAQWNDYEGMGFARMNLGALLVDRSRYDEALDNDREGVACWQRVPPSPAAEINMARMLGDLGIACTGMQQYNDALDALQRARQIFAARQQEPELADTLHSISNVYLDMGQQEPALQLALESLRLRRSLPGQPRLGAPLAAIGMIYRAMGDLDRAEACLQEAEPLLKADGDTSALITCTLAQGNVALQKQQWAQARAAYTRAQAAAQADGDAYQAALAQLDMAALAANGEPHDPNAAIRGYQQALAAFRALRPPSQAGITLYNAEIGTALYNMAINCEEQNNPGEAEILYREALETLESVRAQAADAAQSIALQSVTTGDTYARCARLLARQKRPWKALAMIERGRTVALARQASETRLDVTRMLAPDDARQWTRAQQAVYRAAGLRHAIETAPDAGKANGKPDAVREAAQTREVEAERDLTLLRRALQSRYPQWRPLPYAQPPATEELQALSQARPDTLFLTWSLVDAKSALLIAIPPGGGIQTFEIATNHADLKKIADKWRKEIENGTMAEPQTAQACWQMLLAPAEQAGLLTDRRVHRLLAVPDGPLLSIPFAALRDARGQRLIERFPLAESVSLGLLTWPANARKPTGTLLCVADPLASPAVARRGGTKENGSGAGKENGRGALPRAQEEGRSVAALFARPRLLMGAQAQRAALVPHMGEYAVLHFATHGELDAANGFRSGLTLAPDSGAAQEQVKAGADGKPAPAVEAGGKTAALVPSLLLAREIAETPLSASLAVLSACNSAQGKEADGEGLIGLCWAFRAAGCGSVVASQWPVDDEATRRLMVGFYQALRNGSPKDEALQAAILGLKGQKGQVQPMRWAAFQLLGDCAPLPASLWQPAPHAAPVPASGAKPGRAVRGRRAAL